MVKKNIISIYDIFSITFNLKIIQLEIFHSIFRTIVEFIIISLGYEKLYSIFSYLSNRYPAFKFKKSNDHERKTRRQKILHTEILSRGILVTSSLPNNFTVSTPGFATYFPLLPSLQLLARRARLWFSENITLLFI